MNTRIVVFASASRNGKNLVNRIQTELPSFIQSIPNINIESDFLEFLFPDDVNFSQDYFLYCQVAKDIVIFDGSIEEDSNQELGKNYQCVTHAPYLNDNTLVVSRTPLPLNFIPEVTNVLPIGENYAKNEDVLKQILSYSNDSIINWIKKQIGIRIQKKIFPRPTELKAQFEYKKLMSRTDVLQYSNLLNKEYDRQKKIIGRVNKNPYEHTAFISYRSYYYNHKCGNIDVFDLEKIILDYHKRIHPDEEWKVLFYPPGSLSQDCPTENQRRSLIAFIQDRFKDVAEVWIFDTDEYDERSYWDSWFTQCEYLSLMEINQCLKHLMPQVYVFNPHTETFDRKLDFPKLSKANATKLSIIGANMDNKYGDRAGLINTISFLENWKRNSIFTRLKYRLAMKIIYGIRINQMKDLYVYKSGFISDRVFSCPNCSSKYHYSAKDFENDNFIESVIKVGDTSLEMRKANEEHGVVVINQESFDDGIKHGYVVCPYCHKKLYIKACPEQDKYLWTRHIPNTPSEEIPIIERIAAYSVMQS